MWLRSSGFGRAHPAIRCDGAGRWAISVDGDAVPMCTAPTRRRGLTGRTARRVRRAASGRCDDAGQGTAGGRSRFTEAGLVLRNVTLGSANPPPGSSRLGYYRRLGSSSGTSTAHSSSSVALAVKARLARQFVARDRQDGGDARSDRGRTRSGAGRYHLTRNARDTPPLLADKGLGSALDIHKRGRRRSPFEVDADGVDGCRKTSKPPCTSRVSKPSERREVRTGVERDDHSGSSIGVALRRRPDDSCGFDPNAWHPGAGCRATDLARHVGGTFEVEQSRERARRSRDACDDRKARPELGTSTSPCQPTGAGLTERERPEEGELTVDVTRDDLSTSRLPHVVQHRGGRLRACLRGGALRDGSVCSSVGPREEGP